VCVAIRLPLITCHHKPGGKPLMYAITLYPILRRRSTAFVGTRWPCGARPRSAATSTSSSSSRPMDPRVRTPYSK
jgi:hypothetical protein